VGQGSTEKLVLLVEQLKKDLTEAISLQEWADRDLYRDRYERLVAAGEELLGKPPAVAELVTSGKTTDSTFMVGLRALVEQLEQWLHYELGLVERAQ